MARSDAQKKRLHRKRQGKRDPELNRNKDPDFSTHTRRTASKHDKLKRIRQREDKEIDIDY